MAEQLQLHVRLKGRALERLVACLMAGKLPGGGLPPGQGKRDMTESISWAAANQEPVKQCLVSSLSRDYEVIFGSYQVVLVSFS